MKDSFYPDLCLDILDILLRYITIEDPMINFGENEESLKIRIWLLIQNSNPDPLEKYQVHDKR